MATLLYILLTFLRIAVSRTYPGVCFSHSTTFQKQIKFTGIHSGHNENSNERGSEESIVFFKYDNNNDTKKLIDNLRDYQINSSKVVYKAFI